MSGPGKTSGSQGSEQAPTQATAARPKSAPTIDLDDLAERVYRLLQEDLRLGRLRQGGGR